MNNYRKLIFPLLSVTAFIVLFFLNPSAMGSGVRSGLFLCGETVIPSLFPFMIVSDYLVRSGVGTAVGKALSPLTEKLFRLPGCSACAIFMSLIGGFPVGLRMISQLLESNSLSENQAKRMLWFCVNSGPAFVIGAVGSSMLSNKKCGIILFASQTLAALLIGFVSRFFAKNDHNTFSVTQVHIDPSAFTQSVASATDAMLGICAYILLFSAINPFLIKLAAINPLFNTLVIMSEVTSGCSFAAKILPFYFLAPILCWSGFAVHMQLLPYIKKIGVPIREFWLSRAVNCAVSLPIAYILFRLFPCEAQVFATFSEIIIKPYSVSVPAAVAMLALGAFTIIDINLATEKKI